MKPAGSRPKARRAYLKHGLHGAQRALSKRGISALDGRSVEARALKLWKAQVAADLGDDLSAQQRTILDVAAVDMALLSVADAWLRENAEKIVNRRRRALVALVEQRLKVASHLAGLLKDLGLERRAKDVPRLADYLAARTTPSRAAASVSESLPGPSESLPEVGQ